MEPFSKQNYSDKVAQLIKQRIRSRKLRPGEAIAEARLADECGISRAPVREALHKLESEGLLMSHPRRGKCVTILTPESIRNNYELSGLLESEAALQAVTAMPPHVQERLDQLIAEMRTALAAQAPHERHAELGTMFHETILSLSGNELLRTFATRFSRIISKYLLYQEWQTIYTPEELLDRHYKLYLALQSRDRETISRAFRGHYAESAELLARFCKPARAAFQEKKPGKRAHFPEE